MNNQLIQGISIDWNKVDGHSYLRNIEAIKGLERLEFSNAITFFVGENGSGKSTLLEAIAVAYGFNPESGKQGAQFIIVTHSPILLGIPYAEILTFDDGLIHRCEYEETNSYQVMEMFINNRKQLLERMLTQ